MIMFNPFKQPELIKAETFMSMPAKFRARARTKWSDHNRQGAEVDRTTPRPAVIYGETLQAIAQAPAAGPLLFTATSTIARARRTP
jgi:hypothetical protein